MGSKLTKLAIGAVSLAAGLFFCKAALASLLFVNLGGFICPDNAACDTNPAVNAVTVQAGVAGVPLIPGYTVAISVGTSNNPGSPPFALLDVTWNVSVLESAGGPLTILVSQTGFTFPTTSVATLESVMSGDVFNGAVGGQEWANLSNTLFGLGPITPGPQGPFSDPMSPFASDLSILYSSTQPYSITDRLIFFMGPIMATTTGDMRSTVRSTVTAVPEPATLVLVGAALAGLGFLRRRKES